MNDPHDDNGVFAQEMREVLGSALQVQEGGDHYKKLKIQPVEYIHANSIPFIEGNIIKYATRWRDKGGVQDLRKIIHFAELLIELEQRSQGCASGDHLRELNAYQTTVDNMKARMCEVHTEAAALASDLEMTSIITGTPIAHVQGLIDKAARQLRSLAEDLRDGVTAV